jgi:hypothetical protein
VAYTDAITTTAANAAYVPKTLTTTTGDIIYASAANTPARLGIGSTDQVLKVSGGVPVWATPVSTPTFRGVSVNQSGAGTQSIATATNTVLTFDSEDFDTDGFHDNSTNTSRLTIPTGLGGYYLVSVNLAIQANATGLRSGLIKKNNSDIALFPDISPISGIAYPGYSYQTILNLAAGDYLEVLVYQTSGGNLNFYKRPNDRPFAIQYLGA